MPYESCSLGSINVSNFIKNGEVDWDRLEEVIKISVLFKNRVLDKTLMPIPECQEALERTRKIGIGLMGLHDLLIQMGLGYDSEGGRKFSGSIMKFIAEKSNEMSVELGEKEGVYKGWVGGCPKRRNANLTTIAPTGCQSPSTMVITDKGILKLGEIVDEEGEKWQPIEYEVPQENIKARATKGYVNGEQKTKKILTKTGMELESTLNHQYRVYDFDKEVYYWERADNLRTGDFLASKIGGYDKLTNEQLHSVGVKFNTNANKNINFPEEVSPKFAMLLGLIYSDGSVHDKGIRIHIDRKHTELISTIKSLIKDTLNIDATDDDSGTCMSICINSIPFINFLKINDILKPKAHLVSIPLKVRKSSVESIKSFIHGYWLGDGSTTGGTEYIDTCSKQMALDLAICLRAVGINTNIRIYDKELDHSSFGNRVMYRVYKKGFGSKHFSKNKYRYIKKKDRLKKEFCDTIGGDLFFDEILSIEDSVSMTLDIEVPENNTYIANSFISHNTLSMICDCSSGVEPYYSVITIKHVLDGEKLILINKWFEKKLLESFSEEETNIIIAKVKEAGTINIPEVPENLKGLFKGANDISPENHVLMQAEMQKHVDSSISKTINMPSIATIEDVDRVYRMAWELGCKGVTVYRDGSRDEQVLYNSGAKVKMNEERPDGVKFNLSPKRPKELEADIHHCTIKGVPWVVAVGLFNNMPYELFAGELNDLYIPKTCKSGIVTKEKNGLYSLTIQIRNSKVKFDDIAHTLMDSDQRALTRMVSLALRHGVHYEFIVKQLKKSSGDITDFAAVVNRVLKSYIKQYLYENEKPCPECGGKLIKVEGCEKCSSCGISKCG